MPSFLERIAKSALNRAIKRGVDRVLDGIFGNKKPKPQQEVPPKAKSPSPKPEVIKTHPWRLCLIGEHWVEEQGRSGR